MGRKRVKKRRKSCYNHELYRFTEPNMTEWNKLKHKAIHGEIDEEQRANVAARQAMMDAIKTFCLSLKKGLVTYNTNLGLLLGYQGSITSTFVSLASGDKFENEYIPVLLAFQMSEDIHDLEDHVKFLCNKWEENEAPSDSLVSNADPPTSSPPH